MEKKNSRRAIWLSLGTIGVTALIAIAWEPLALALAMASPETRPALLSDAKWNNPSSAFRDRFGAGTPEDELLNWLSANRFEVDRLQHTAVRHVRSLPCNERIEITCEAKSGAIRDSTAVVFEAGCL